MNPPKWLQEKMETFDFRKPLRTVGGHRILFLNDRTWDTDGRPSKLMQGFVAEFDGDVSWYIETGAHGFCMTELSLYNTDEPDYPQPIRASQIDIETEIFRKLLSKNEN